MLIHCLLLLPLWVSVFVPSFVVQYFVSFLVFAIILIGKRELVALLCLPYWCLVTVTMYCSVILPHAIGIASTISVKFRGIRPRMYIEDLL